MLLTMQSKTAATFLYSAIGSLVMEATERAASFAMPGVRVLLLYPMNALVSDQTSRLRRLFGDERMAGLFETRWGRRPRFGMYTSRTAYPGIRTNDKDGRNIAPLLEYFVELEESEDEDKQNLVKELKSRGRWPAKDLIGFFAPDEEEVKTYKSGKNAGKTFRSRHWDHRLFTQPGDRELLTRHEIQKNPPDLLVTNYSMLEYMLLRPIERSIFRKTSDWLASDPRNQFLLILDEAHMYRGVSGAEVGLLIRRLQSRLGISRDQMRCILTSASLGDGATAETAGKAFGEALTGKRRSGGFTVIRGTKEARPKSAPGTTEVVVHFEHPEDGQNAQAGFGLLGLGKIKVFLQKCNLRRNGYGRFTVRWHLADPRVQSLRELMLLKELLFGLPIEGFCLNPTVEPRQVVGSHQQRLWTWRDPTPEDFIPDNAQQGGQYQTGCDAKGGGDGDSHSARLLCSQYCQNRVRRSTSSPIDSSGLY